MPETAENMITRLLAQADVRVGGDCAWDIQVRDRRFFDRVLAHGSLGAGEAWMDGMWDCQALDQCLTRIMDKGLDKHFRLSWRALVPLMWQRWLNPQSRRRARIIGKRHYDIGNDLYQRMLDQRMVYSCAYWQNAQTLDDAQQHKLELICRKLQLQPGMRLLDIGCGWGSLVKHAAENHGVKALGITVSQQQEQLARERCKGLPIEIRNADYRDIDEPFDRIASVGMIEHVGWRNYRTFMQVVHRCLSPGGMLLLHTIGSNSSVKSTDPWIARYIFPNSQLPSLAQLAQAAEQLLLVEDLHSMGPFYDRTLLAWHDNFTRAWPELASRYGERFGRMWIFYLLASAAAFRSRSIQLWQLLLVKPPAPAVPATIR